MILKDILLIITLLVLAEQKIVSYSSKVGVEIFQERLIYLLIVKSKTLSPSINLILEKVCQQFDNCAELTDKQSEYQEIKNFLGNQEQNFIAIIDSQNQKKYILQISQQFSEQSLNEFVTQFNQNILEPYYASDPIPQEYTNKTRLFQLVGLNYELFLSQQEPIKIVYLYTADEICLPCSDLLQKYKSIAAKHHENGIILFGMIDLIKNDNKYIKDEIFPYFLIYVRDNFQDPYGVDAQQFEQLEIFIEQLKREVKGIQNSADNKEQIVGQIDQKQL